jgi:hypothetical protein
MTASEGVVMPSIDEMREGLRQFVQEHAIAPSDEPLPDDPDPEFGPDERL